MGEPGVRGLDPQPSVSSFHTLLRFSCFCFSSLVIFCLWCFLSLVFFVSGVFCLWFVLYLVSGQLCCCVFRAALWASSVDFCLWWYFCFCFFLVWAALWASSVVVYENVAWICSVAGQRCIWTMPSCLLQGLDSHVQSVVHVCYCYLSCAPVQLLRGRTLNIWYAQIIFLCK